MSQEPIFIKAVHILLQYLQGELVPTILSSPDMIKLTYPGQEDEFRLGLFLYDLEEVRPNGPPGMTQLSEDTRRHPDLSLIMRLMVFANRNVAFNSMETADELLMLEAVYRAVHSTTKLELDGQNLQLRFLPITQSEKISLWQSIGSPLQSAVYISLEPIPVPSTRIQRIPPIREVEIHTNRMGRGLASL